MDQLPEEILLIILNFAMMRDDPFCILKCIHIIMLAKRYPGGKIRVPESQESHLRDWNLVAKTCRRLNRLGEEAFFSQKCFVMSSCFAKKLQNLEADPLSVSYQQAATRFIKSVVFTDISMVSPSVLLALPLRVSSFPRLERLDLVFRLGESDEIFRITEITRDRQPAWTHLTENLALIGVPTEKLNIGMIKCERKWPEYESALRERVYPGLELWRLWEQKTRGLQ